jgi:hypothetical protein
MTETIELNLVDITTLITAPIISDCTINRINKLLELYKQENNAISNLNKKRLNNIKLCMDILIESSNNGSRVDASTLLSLTNNNNLSGLMCDISKHIKKKGIWNIKKGKTCGKLQYWLEPDFQ